MSLRGVRIRAAVLLTLSTKHPGYPKSTLTTPLPDPQIPLFPGVGSKLMGELRRGTKSWDVFLECEGDRANGVTRGRLHFVSGGRTVTSAWIFLEWTARDVEARFHEFGAAELWGLVEGIG
jgi:hypothetical protein